MQIAPSHKHSLGIFGAQKINFAKHNMAHKNLLNAYKKRVHQCYQKTPLNEVFISLLYFLLRLLSSEFTISISRKKDQHVFLNT